MYTAKHVAQYILNRCSVDGELINNLKLQALLYFVWINYRQLAHKRLFNDVIYAWQFGPAIPDIYYDYCSYGGMDIDIRYSSDDVGIDVVDAEILDASLTKYRNYSVSRLVEMTHAVGKPWYQVYVVQGNVKKEIPFSLIEKTECQ